LDELLAVKAKLVERSMQQSQLTRQWVIEKLMKNARIALGEEKVKVSTVDKETGTRTEVEVVDRDPSAANKALELLGKTLGVFIERKEVGAPGDFAAMTTDELRDIIARDMAALGLSLEMAKDKGGSRKAGSQLN
jgi:phage terminase small subunit